MQVVRFGQSDSVGRAILRIRFDAGDEQNIVVYDLFDVGQYIG